MLTMLLTAMISVSAASGSGASGSVQVGGYVLGTCRAPDVASAERVDAAAVTPRCTRAVEVSVSRETAEADETQLVRVLVTPRQ